MPKFKGSKIERDVLGAFVGLVRASEAFFNRTHAHLEDEELTLSEFAVLEALYHVGPLFQVDIAKRILRSRGSITQTIDKLEERSLVTRDRESEDRRCITVKLTPSGQKLIDAVFKKHLTIMTKEMSVLNSAEQRQLRDLCRKLSKGFDDSTEEE